MLRKFAQVIELLPGENAIAVWLCTWQLARGRTHGDDYGLCFEAFFFAVVIGCNNKMVSVEATGATDDSHAGIVEVLQHVI